MRGRQRVHVVVGGQRKQVPDPVQVETSQDPAGEDLALHHFEPERPVSTSSSAKSEETAAATTPRGAMALRKIRSCTERPEPTVESNTEAGRATKRSRPTPVDARDAAEGR